MTMADYCALLFHSDMESPAAQYALEQLLRVGELPAEAIESVLVGVQGLLTRIEELEKEAEEAAVPDKDDIIEALDYLNIEDVAEVVDHGITLIKATKDSAKEPASHD
jgi:hypothetical protein